MVSIVIPVFNEEDHLKACLDSIAAQTIKPYEVIIVDNNCTDKSLAIARQYNFVTILREERQHQSFAQATGYDHASGDIFGRIDADSVLPPDWVEKITKAFADRKVVAVTGTADPYDMAFKKIALSIFVFYQVTLNRLMNGHDILWGANCAFRASAWVKIRDKLTLSNNIWEDYDMSYPLAKLGRILYLPGLAVGCSFRASHKSFQEQIEYQFRVVRTYKLHHGWIRTGLFFLIRASVLLLLPLVIADTVARKLKRIS